MPTALSYRQSVLLTFQNILLIECIPVYTCFPGYTYTPSGTFINIISITHYCPNLKQFFVYVAKQNVNFILYQPDYHWSVVSSSCSCNVLLTSQTLQTIARLLPQRSLTFYHTTCPFIPSLNTVQNFTVYKLFLRVCCFPILYHMQRIMFSQVRLSNSILCEMYLAGHVQPW